MPLSPLSAATRTVVPKERHYVLSETLADSDSSSLTCVADGHLRVETRLIKAESGSSEPDLTNS